jgi:Carboxypeptidase regulatory-like domain
MNARTFGIAAGLVAGWLSIATAVAAPPGKLAGSIGGSVTSAVGIPQMGATVLLYNHAERLLQRVLTDETGSFLFDALTPDVYSIRVSLTSFVPALKRNIIVQPGMRSLLNVSLSGVLSSIELIYSSTGNGALMNDDWKWVLRASSSTRPALRIAPRIDISDPSERRHSQSVFGETRGMVKVSAGDSSTVSAYGNEPDLGTAFALATSVYGSNQVQVSGNIGYAAVSGMPTAGFRTRYSRDLPGGNDPEVRVTMRQLFLPARTGTAIVTGQTDGVPALRTMSFGFQDRAQLTDNLRADYGFSMESVSFLERLNYFSPFARVTYGKDETGAVEFGYSSGLPPAEFFAMKGEAGNDLQQDLAALSLFPRVSLREGRVRVQRTENFEVGYRKVTGSRTFSMAAYSESLNNAAITMVAPAGSFPSSDLLPDLLSNSSVFNLGRYAGFGYMGSLTQELAENLNVTGAFGSGTALTPDGSQLLTEKPDEVRGIMRHGRRYWLAVKLTAKAPHTGTLLTTSYRWADGRSLNAGHYYLTQNLRPEIGWSMYLRQPIPVFSGLPGRFEATADLRNLLAEGYVPLLTPQGRRVYLLHTPRSVRGGLSFVF